MRNGALLLLAALLLTWLLLLPGYIGIANNGDFPKVTRRFDLSPADGARSDFLYFVPNYNFASANHWVSPVVSSEIALAAAPIELIRALGFPTFNIRWLGALNIALFLASFLLGLLYLRRFGFAVQAVAAIAILWIAGDVAYTAYFNSFYSDTAAILGLLLAFIAAVHIASDDRPSLAMLVVFGAGALLYVTSKTQHGLFFFAPFAFAIWTARRVRPLRLPSLAVAGFLLAGFAYDVFVTPANYATQALFNVIFFKLTPHSTGPERELAELGLPASDLRYVGMHAFLQGSPVDDPAWARDFLERCGYVKLARFYLQHPQWIAVFLYRDLKGEAEQMRPHNLSNFQRSAGRPAGARTDRWSSWSNLRSSFFRAWPWYVVVWFALFLAVAAYARGRLSAVAIGVALTAGAEFVFSSLADGAETYRHLLIFHLLTDLTVIMALVWTLNRGKSVMLRSLWRN